MPGAQCPLTQNHRHGIRASWNGDILLKWTPYSQERLGPLLLFALNSKVRAGLDLPLDLAGILGVVLTCFVILVSKVCLQSAGCGVHGTRRARGIAGTRVRRVVSPVSRDLDLTRLVIPDMGVPQELRGRFVSGQPGARRSLGGLSTGPSEGSARRFGRCSTRVLPGDGTRTKSSRNFERGTRHVTALNEVGLEQCATAVKTDAL